MTSPNSSMRYGRAATFQALKNCMCRVQAILGQDLMAEALAVCRGRRRTLNAIDMVDVIDAKLGELSHSMTRLDLRQVVDRRAVLPAGWPKRANAVRNNNTPTRPDGVRGSRFAASSSWRSRKDREFVRGLSRDSIKPATLGGGWRLPTPASTEHGEAIDGGMAACEDITPSKR